jgi:site-specific recombinase XerD
MTTPRSCCRCDARNGGPGKGSAAAPPSGTSSLAYAEYARQIGREADAQRLAHASTHWLRHTYAKGLAVAVSNGLDTRAALENMGHADARTFNQYVDDEPLKRALARRASL